MEPISDFKVWYCTGTSTGIGLSIVKKLLLQQTNRVVAITRNPQKLEKEIPVEHLPNLLAIKTDITNEESVKQSISKTMETFGRIDVVVNNAGVGIIGAVEELSDQEFRKAFDVNFFSVLHVCRNVAPIMRKQKSGLIMNVASVLAWFTVGEYAAYNTTKYALNGLTSTLGQELAPFGIKVVLLSPSGFKTNFVNDNMESAKVRIEGYKTDDLAKWLDGIVNEARGDPDKFADAVIAVSKMDEVPKNLFLGTAAVNWMEGEFKKQIDELKLNHELTISTDFPNLPPL
ncbi:short-chain dehydrogenase/reductase family protein [Dictyostelium discoideum AX4]|uniref:Short-chain dehydrogenase/reductase family protein n=1 Tax=Dictyostelium discoideum TaxID=44689 RepID=Q54HZ2_DICDI|nr:short-chain dehydrogenase/reductase family protein [Dictyostelium discoideum AX4]EAL62871.1 short-chain dehydrogenase/reductase family protein [Dictyostelium discoideum AX4]|eukprot:XP_636371.1 short-chain dehydrogenase/reductase family protein [Dictyostelium discoideum AX4]